MQKLHVSNKLQLFFTIHGTFMNSLYTIRGKKTTGFLLFFLLSFSLAAQQKTKIILQSSEKSRIVTKTDITYLRKPVFKQDNAILSCDSAVFYTKKNYFEAYDNVHINQADTINIYSDRLTYDGNAKLAHLSSNVRLVDKTSTLTTNILDYSMAPKVGTYVEGGKIVNKDATITSKNGYYFANSRDAYFRYNVIVVTEQSTIKSDTLRYNTLTNWAYFYGPTNIKEKDGGNLYTENGAYNTKTTYAYFGKKNLYTSGSRSLKGDSLYYDGIAGYGKAVRNIVFKDTVDKMVMHGQLGFYYKKDQRTLVTKTPYAGMGTEDSIMVKNVKVPDSLWLGADTLETQMVRQKTLKLIKGPAIKKDNELGDEEREGKPGKGKTAKVNASAKKPAGAPAGTGKTPGITPGDKKKLPPGMTLLPSSGKDSLKKDSLAKGSIPLKKTDSLNKGSIPLIKKADSLLKGSPPVLKKTDSTLKTAVQKAVSGTKPATDPKLAPNTKPAADPKLTVNPKLAADPKLKKDSLPADSLKPNLAAKKTDPKTAGKIQLGVKKTNVKDSLPFNPADTVMTRILKAYHHVNVFKTNMQAKADSLFYTSADSTLRWYRNPIIWSQGSQQTGDTIYLQLRNKKLNSVQVIQTAFSVNVETDSTKFNQIKGKLITGFFKDGKLDRMYVDGNAESVYFTKTDDGKKYDKVNQTISSRIKITFKKGDIADVVPIKDVEGATTPVADLKQDIILTGFIWKPELRPRSKRDITNPKPLQKPKTTTATTAAKDGKGIVKGAVKDPKTVSKDAKTAAGQLTPAAVKSLITKDPAGTGLIKQLTKAADSLSKKPDSLLKLQKKVPAKLIDTAMKVAPGLLKKADSLSRKPVTLKNQ